MAVTKLNDPSSHIPKKRGGSSKKVAQEAKPKRVYRKPQSITVQSDNPLAKKRARNRPTVYQREDYLAIIAEIAEGKTVRSIFRENQTMNRATFYQGLLEDKELSDQYARAKEYQAEIWFDEMEEIASEKHITIKDKDGENIEVKFDMAAVAHQRLRIDTRKWQLAKMMPKKYGERIEIDSNVSVAEDTLAQLAKIGEQSLAAQSDLAQFVQNRRAKSEYADANVNNEEDTE